MDTNEQTEIRKAFREAVNMTPAGLVEWLETDESKEVGWKGNDGKGSGESVGHRSGKRIIELQRKAAEDLNEDDYAHMRKVIGYIRRHVAQGPIKDEDKQDSRWRRSLMNWGHDPLK